MATPINQKAIEDANTQLTHKLKDLEKARDLRAQSHQMTVSTNDCYACTLRILSADFRVAVADWIVREQEAQVATAEANLRTAMQQQLNPAPPAAPTA
jgi:hypothetical protein